MATSSASSRRPSRTIQVFLVEGVDTDNNEIIGDLVPAVSRTQAIAKVRRARPYMGSLTAQTINDHLLQAVKLATIPLTQVQQDWERFAAEQTEIYL